ncbi:hypothetical protein Tsubulata_011967 [Turnera subulata]|uniref:DUF4283 domain-containing protein n=1 Tax=Turnera subulata TaxID=218843 RepID=A0A9Q0FES7_9ROSI|nr:hypothetical protein Tsubulata_011967 [Turnera subulata]
MKGKREDGKPDSQQRVEANTQSVTFIPSIEVNRWLTRCAVGVANGPRKMESICLVWRLHDMDKVEVIDMGGDSFLVCFPSPEKMMQFLQHPPEWVSLWFRLFSPWKSGDKATNRRCWVTVRGVPLNAWCQEFFETVGSEFGQFLRVDEETD